MKVFKVIYNIIPALVSFLLILLFFSQIFWQWQILNFLVLLLCIYLFYKGIISVVGSIVGLFKFRVSQRVDWQAECLKLIKAKDFAPHLFIIPSFSESFEMLYDCVKSITKLKYPQEKIFIAISFEQRRCLVDENYLTWGKSLQQLFKNSNIFTFIHPFDLDDEVPGAAANRSWCAAFAVEELRKRNCNLEDFLVTTLDSDTTLDKNYAACVFYNFLQKQKSENFFYQTMVYVFYHKFWQHSLLAKVNAMSVTTAVLAGVLNPRKIYTFSCYTLKLSTLIKVNFWDKTLGIDDTTFYWRCFDVLKGEFSCVPIYLAVNSYAITQQGFFKSLTAQYAQIQRWAYGIISFPKGVKILVHTPGIKLHRRFESFVYLLDFYTLLKVVSFISIFTFPFIFFGNFSEEIKFAKLLLQIITFYLPFFIVFKYLLLPSEKFYKKIFFMILDFPINLILLIFFRFPAHMIAATRLAFNLPISTSLKWTHKDETSPTLKTRTINKSLPNLV